jgi:hypothetical protein
MAWYSDEALEAFAIVVWSLAFVLFLVALALPCPLCRRDVRDWTTCCNKCVASLLGLLFVSHLVTSDEGTLHFPSRAAARQPISWRPHAPVAAPTPSHICPGWWPQILQQREVKNKHFGGISILYKLTSVSAISNRMLVSVKTSVFDAISRSRGLSVVFYESCDLSVLHNQFPLWSTYVAI